jgi:plasmid replication initiation protein
MKENARRIKMAKCENLFTKSMAMTKMKKRGQCVFFLALFDK